MGTPVIRATPCTADDCATYILHGDEVPLRRLTDALASDCDLRKRRTACLVQAMPGQPYEVLQADIFAASIESGVTVVFEEVAPGERFVTGAG